MKSVAVLLTWVLLLTGCVSPASVPEQTHPLATALPEPDGAAPVWTPEPAQASPVEAPALTESIPEASQPPQDPSQEAAARAAGYLEILTGQDLSNLPCEVEFLAASGDGEWNVSFALPDQPVSANVRFEADGTLTFYALWTHGKTDASLILPLAPMPQDLSEADYEEIAAYWYERLPIREDAPFRRTELARKGNTRQYPSSAYVLNTVKMRFEDGSVLTCQYDQGTRRLAYLCHYTAKSLGR